MSVTTGRRQGDIKMAGDSNSSDANVDLCQRLWLDGSNSCDNTVAKQTWLGGSVSNSNGRNYAEDTVAART